MNKDNQFSISETVGPRSLPVTGKGKFDLLILRYMAQHVEMTLHLSDQPVNKAKPLLCYSQERHGRKHRIALYKPQELLGNTSLAFVGFVSGKRKPGSPHIVTEIHSVDKQLIGELTYIPGILSYSSLELHDGNWCNLVLLSDSAAKQHIQRTQMHTYAAYHLAPRFYVWIRIHNGLMPAGLANKTMILERSRHYLFEDKRQHPAIHELTYEI